MESLLEGINTTMDNEVAIKVEHVSKKYCKSLKRSMLYGIADIGRNALGMGSHPDKLRKNEFWAVDDVSFEVKKGEVLGIIGPNGAGKTTLLKMLNGIFWPDKGKITIKGRVGALIQVGAGFHPLLTGRENIYINAAILGMTKKEVDKKLDDIIEFADIGDFIDAPVKFYSSGMFVRLGLSVAVHCEPDILLIDEVFAVGDIGFRAKCYNFISELMKDTAVIFVSHSMPYVNRYCTRVILLNHGRLLFCGDPSESIEKYYRLFESESGTFISDGKNRIEEFVLMDTNNKVIDVIEHSSTLRIKISCTLDTHIKFPNFKIVFLNRELQVVAGCRTTKKSIVNNNGFISLIVDIAPFILSPADYKISVFAYDEEIKRNLFLYNAYWDLKVTGESRDYGSAAVHFAGKWQTI